MHNISNLHHVKLIFWHTFTLMLFVIRFEGKNSVKSEELLPELDKLEVSAAERVHCTINTLGFHSNYLWKSHASEFNMRYFRIDSVIINSGNSSLITLSF